MPMAALKKLPNAISHPVKIFWPDERYTKPDLFDFYQTIFLKLQPYVKDRILSLERCPNGMLGECFYQKKSPKGCESCSRGSRRASARCRPLYLDRAFRAFFSTSRVSSHSSK
jgi:DNA primase